MVTSDVELQEAKGIEERLRVKLVYGPDLALIACGDHCTTVRDKIIYLRRM